MLQDYCRRESPRPKFFLDVWGFVESVLHLRQQDIHIQSRGIVGVDLNRHGSAHRGRIAHGNLTVNDRIRPVGDSRGEPLQELILLFACPRPDFNEDKGAIACRAAS
jgi:hypothetical protein